MNKKISITFILLAFLSATAISVSADYARIEIPFNEEIFMIQENLLNSSEELVFTVLYTSNPEIAGDTSAKICELDNAEIQEQIRTYENQSRKENIENIEEPEDIETSDCDAVRIVYRYAPSPIPADAKLIGAEMDFGSYDLEFILSKMISPDNPSVTRFVQYLPTEKIDVAFFGEEGGKIYDETDKSLDQIKPAASTRNQFHIYTEDFLSALHHFELSILFDQQYVHQNFTRNDWASVGDDRTIERSFIGFSSLLDGEFAQAGGGGNEPSEVESFDGPINTSQLSMAENHRYLDSGLELNRISFDFNTYPRLKFAYTIDGTYIHLWGTGLNTYMKWVVNFPDMENIHDLPAPQDWLHNIINH